MSLARAPRPSARVTLVPLIDVLFILLVYFMVTSVYLDLDMIPAAGGQSDGIDAPAGAGDGQSTTLMVRIDPAGNAVLRGETLGMPALTARLADAMAAAPGLEVVLLPSPRAPVQALASALDALSEAGVTRSRVLRLEARE